MKTTLYMPLLSVFLYATGIADTAYRQIHITEDFSRICLRGNMKVILQQRSGGSMLQYKNGKITAEVKDGELQVKQKNNWLTNDQPIVIIAVKNLEAISVMDNAAVFSHGRIQCTALFIDQRSDGVIKLSVMAENVQVYSRGKGKIQVEGNFTQTVASKDEAGNMIIEYSREIN